MGGKSQKKFLTVAPFECAWREELSFMEAGRGCIAFEAFAQNDVTLVFREQVGSQHYHYKMDNSPNYTVILGSHRNRRLKIQVDGKTVVDVAGVGLCCSSAFQSYWISIYDGLISIGKGRYPFKNLVFQWLDSNPNYSIKYVGLSSWDKHVGYRNINVLPLTRHTSSLWTHIDYKEYEGKDVEDRELEDVTDDYEKWGLMNFLESWDLSDVIFLVGTEINELKTVPGHMVILNAFGDFSSKDDDGNIIQLSSTAYPVLHAFLEYIYAGRTAIVESQLASLRDLSIQFQVHSLIKQCDEVIDRFKTNKKIFDSGKKVELVYTNDQYGIFPCEVPVDVRKIKQFLATGEHSDVNIYIEGHGLVARSHKIILSLWSVPFAKMFTNGMIESSSSDIVLRDVSVGAFIIMLQFMYSGELEMDRGEMDSLLIPLLLLSDQFGVTYLQQECCKNILDFLSEDRCCPEEAELSRVICILQI